MVKEKETEKSENIAEEIVKEEKEVIKELKKNPWIASTFVFAIIAMILLFFAFKGGIGASKNSVGEKAVEFINAQILAGQGSVTLSSVSEKGGLYEVKVNYKGQEIPTYFTKDGKYYLGTQMVELSLIDTQNQEGQESVPAEIPKSDKPKVELFVMTHCPYGTQAEKGILPALKSLGNKVDGKIRFVHYTMHGDKEVEETNRQVCIRETMPTLYTNYLSCFLEDGNSTRCMTKTGVSSTAITTCINGKSKDYYAVDSDLSKSYGVQGSPTLIINGVETQFYPRSPSNALAVICSAFNTAPSECSTNLSSENPSPGFGTSTTTANTDASCG